MLRKVVLIVGGAAIVTSLAAILFGNRDGAIVFLVYSVLVVLALIYERVRYKPVLAAPPTGAGWTRTGERFVDPGSGQMVIVYSHTGTGERAYVADQEAKS